MPTETHGASAARTDFRLPSHVVPSRYDITLRPDLGQGDFTGRETIEVEILEPTSTIVLNVVDLDLRKVSIGAPDGTSLEGTVSLNADTQLASIRFDGVLGAGNWALEIEFAGVLSEQLRGFYKSSWNDATGNKRLMASTHFEPTHARRAFPCFDEPAFKARFKIALEIDEQLTAVSNGKLLSQSRIDSGARKTGRNAESKDARGQVLKRLEFAETIPLSTYLVAFVIGDLLPSSTVDVNGKEIRVWSTPGKERLTSFALSAAAFAVDFYENYFEIPYPGDKIDHIAIPDFPIGAMENLGCITFRETALLVDETQATYAALSRVAEVVMHELAHMWFGDLVTMSWWNGLWLKESFATFMANVCLQAWKPEWHAWKEFATSRAAAFETDSLDSTHAIENPVCHPDEATEMFDIISYQKGCSVLYQLHEFLGPEIFRQGCVRYLKSHSFGNTETHDLWDALEGACKDNQVDVPVRKLMDAWVYGLGHPIVEVEDYQDGESDGTMIRLEQSKFKLSGNTSDISEPLPIPLRLRIIRENGDCELRRILLTGNSNLVYIGPGARLAIANDGGSGFYRVLYRNGLAERVVGGLRDLSDVERFNLINDSWSAVRAGSKTADEHLDLIKLFGSERDYTVWEAIIGSLDHISTLVQGKQADKLADLVRKLMRPTLAELGWQTSVEQSIHQRKLRAALVQTLGTIGEDEEVRREVTRLLGSFRKDGKSVDTEMVPAIITVSAYTGDETLYEEFRSRAKAADNPQDAIRYLFALARFKDKKLLERTLGLCLTSEVRSQDAPNLVASVVRNEAGGTLAWNYIRDNFAEMQRLYPELAMGRMLGSLSSLDRKEQAMEIREFLSEQKLKAAQTAVRQMLERLEVNLRLRERESGRLLT